MQNVDPEFRELKHQVIEQGNRLSKVEGEIRQLNRTAFDTSKQTIWQFVIFTITMAGVVIGALNYQTSALNRQFDARIAITDQRIIDLEKRLEMVDRNMNTRFEDLKQEVRSRKQ